MLTEADPTTIPDMPTWLLVLLVAFCLFNFIVWFADRWNDAGRRIEHVGNELGWEPES